MNQKELLVTFIDFAGKIVKSRGLHCRTNHDTLKSARESADRQCIEDPDRCLVYCDEHMIIVKQLEPSTLMEVRRVKTGTSVLTIDENGRPQHIDPEINELLQHMLAVYKTTQRTSTIETS